MALLVVFALVWSVASSLSICPHSLSYFNELAAVLPTPVDTSYPKPIAHDGENQGILSKIKWAISAGPRNGPRHLLDSNIDWGQDVFYLRDWLAAHADVKPDGLAVWGSYPSTLAGIPETRTPPACSMDGLGGQSHFGLPASRMSHGEVTAEDGSTTDYLGPKPGWYALSVNYIYACNREYRYFLHFEPVATAGYSIYIYHITINEANRVRRELGLPELKAESRKRKAMEPQMDTDERGG